MAEGGTFSSRHGIGAPGRRPRVASSLTLSMESPLSEPLVPPSSSSLESLNPASPHGSGDIPLGAVVYTRTTPPVDVRLPGILPRLLGMGVLVVALSAALLFGASERSDPVESARKASTQP